jgi:RNA polymerase sigma-70 factor (ECF subfamily)
MGQKWREGPVTEMHQNKQDDAAFEDLLMPLLDVSYGMAFHLARNREEAEDLVQETAVLAFRAFHTFQRGTNFKAWLFKILLNCFRTQCRKRKREPTFIPLEDAAELYLFKQDVSIQARGTGANPAAIVISKMREEQIRAAIGALPEEYQMVCILYFMEELAYQEIAEALGCPVGTVRSRLHRGRRMLQRALWDVTEAYQMIPGTGVQSEAML